jgi:hypothetical protein
MAFGKNKDDVSSGDAEVTSTPEADDDLDGPFDIDDFDDPATATVGRLDLGSVLIPLPEAGQVQVELTQQGVPSAVWVVTPNGRFTVAAYAAPKSAGLWREVASELAESLRKDAGQVSIKDGKWGREVVGVAPGAQGQAGMVRFIGVDGYRWMIRCVVNGPEENADALAKEARDALADTVVRRGDTPLPVRTPLPVELPEAMANQLRAAAEQQAAQQAQQPGEQPPQPPTPAARRSERVRRCSSCGPSPAVSDFGAPAIAQRTYARRNHNSSSAETQAAPRTAGSAPISARVTVRNAARGAAVIHSMPTSTGCTGSSVAAAMPIGTPSRSSSLHVGAT